MFPVSRSRLRQRHYGPATFESVIYSLFANGEQGAAYDPNDLSSMWQDAAGTVPVTAAGQPVGRIIDKSGRGNHATQPTAASRPMLRQSATTGAYYLEFDGSDDFLRTNNIDFTSTDKVAIFAGVRKLSDVSIGVLFELSANTNTNAGVLRRLLHSLQGLETLLCRPRVQPLQSPLAMFWLALHRLYTLALEI